MQSVKVNKDVNPLVILVQVLFLFVSVSAYSQTNSSYPETKQTYRNHEEIDVGGGMKVEILKCSGEGPAEICDCIYFTDKRQNGTRMKQNANRIKEEERAAVIAQNINKPQSGKARTALITSANRDDKAIPLSITPDPNAPKRVRKPTLQDAAMRADSIAKARSRKFDESMAATIATEDSAEADKVYIPQMTTAQGIRVDTAAKSNAQNTSSPDKSTGITSVKKDTSANTVAPANNPPVSANESKSAVITDTNANRTSATITPVPVAALSKPAQQTTAEAAKKEAPKPTSSAVSTPALAKPAPVEAVIQAKKDTSVALPPVTGIALQNEDTAEHNWVKQYQHIKTAADSVAPAVNKTVQDNVKQTVSTANTTEAPKALANADPGTISTPVLKSKNADKKEENVKKQPTAAIKANTSKNNSAIAVNNPGVTPMPESIKDTATSFKANNIFKDTMTNQPLVPGATISGKEMIEKKDSLAGSTTSTAITNSPTKESSFVVSDGNASASKMNVIGKTAEVSSKGEWQKVTIIDKETEFLYKVHYIGKTAEDNEWVPVTQLRNIDSTVIVTAPAKNVTAAAKNVKPASIPKVVVNVNCSFEAPAPPVSNADKFSEKIAKRKIYESNVTAQKGNNGVKTGVTFLSLKTEEAYVNTVTISATNTLEFKLALAPAGAMIYPVTAQYKLCEQVLGKTTSKTINANYACFRNKEGKWTCEEMK